MFGCNSSVLGKAAVGLLVFVAHGEAAAAEGAVPAPAVTVSPVVSRQVTETADFVGRVVAIDKVDVVARVPGFIEERNFTEGQQVKTGDLLFRIELDTYKAAVDQQKANVAKAKATEVNTALQLQRGKELIHNQTIPQSTLDQRAEALLQQAQINLGYTEIRSPINGRVGLAIYTVGNLVAPSSGRLATIVSQDPIYVTFPASERDVIAYRHRLAESGGKNQHLPVHIKLPDGTIYNHPGITNFLDVQVETNTDTVIVRAEFPNPEGVLVPGGIVGVGVDTGPSKWALLVPQSAIQLDQAGHFVLVVDSAKKVELRRVTTSVELGRNVVVTDGLKEGELVIVEGIQKVHAGQVVSANVAPSN
jgi:membrane fusion protein, multidrug efflux system